MTLRWLRAPRIRVVELSRHQESTRSPSTSTSSLVMANSMIWKLSISTICYWIIRSSPVGPVSTRRWLTRSSYTWRTRRPTKSTHSWRRVSSEERTSRRPRWGSKHAWKPLKRWLRMPIKSLMTKVLTMECLPPKKPLRPTLRISRIMTSWTSRRV